MYKRLLFCSQKYKYFFLYLIVQTPDCIKSSLQSLKRRHSRTPQHKSQNYQGLLFYLFSFLVVFLYCYNAHDCFQLLTVDSPVLGFVYKFYCWNLIRCIKWVHHFCLANSPSFCKHSAFYLKRFNSKKYSLN